MEPAFYGVGASPHDGEKSGHSFTDRLAAQKSRAFARREQNPISRGVPDMEPHCGIAPGVARNAVQEPPPNVGRKHFSPGQRCNEDITSDSVAEGSSGAAKVADRFAAQKSRALARRMQNQGIGEAPSIEDTSGTSPKITGKPQSLDRNNFRPSNRRSQDIPSFAGATQENSPNDSLAQLIKERDSGVGYHMARGEALEARRRAVPGLIPPSSADSNMVTNQRLVSTQPPLTQGGCLPSVPWGSGHGSEPVTQTGFGPGGSGHGIAHGIPSRREGSNVWAKGNAGNMITDRPTSRVLKPPGGGSSFVVGKW